MKLHSGVSGRQLLQMLGDALHKEADTWKSDLYLKHSEISPEQRDETVKWLVQLNAQFEFYPETLALTVAILDRFLHLVKVRPKYLRCIGVTCLYLVAKTCEEDEVIPCTGELVEESRCGCRVSDVLRMERVILDKLNWDLRMITSLDFLHIFHGLLLSNCPSLYKAAGLTASSQLSSLTVQLQRCQTYHRLLRFRPSTLALALLSLQLGRFRPDWLSITVALQSLLQVGNDSLIRCREEVSRYLCYTQNSRTAVLCNSLEAVASKACSSAKATKRKVGQIDDDDDDIYDGIKRLYNEDGSELVTVAPSGGSDHVTVTSTCGSEARQEAAGIPSLETVVN